MKPVVNQSLIKKWQGALEMPIGRALKTQSEAHTVACLKIQTVILVRILY